MYTATHSSTHQATALQQIRKETTQCCEISDTKEKTCKFSPSNGMIKCQQARLYLLSRLSFHQHDVFQSKESLDACVTDTYIIQNQR